MKPSTILLEALNPAQQANAYTCPKCEAKHSTHSGELVQIDPGGPKLSPPVELRKCLACKHRFRADGVPYDLHVQTARWRMHHAQHPDVWEAQHHTRTEHLPRPATRRALKIDSTPSMFEGLEE